ncbi:MAG: 8-amino-7-oxononanoate synthase [Acidimicrobiales bacterium]
MTVWSDLVDGRLEAVRTAGRWRSIRALDGGGPVFALDDGREVVSFASNDYLGLSQHPVVRSAAVSAIERWGTGSGSARLIVGDRPVHRLLEAELSGWRGCEATLLFPTGFAANLGVITTLGQPGVLIVSDELNHASIIDATRLARAEVAIARHRDFDHVAELVSGHRGPTMVVSETVFSMDGDVAPTAELAGVCVQHGSLLVLDEAHGVLGPPAPPMEGLDLIRVGTLSKALGALGGFACGSRAVIDLLVNAARSFIFTTAPSPADVAAARAALKVIRSDEGGALIARLRAHVERIAPGHPSPIVPVVLGDEQRALDASRTLLDDFGLLVPAIRPPTVAPGTSRLRVALSAAHTADQVELLAKALAALA